MNWSISYFSKITQIQIIDWSVNIRLVYGHSELFLVGEYISFSKSTDFAFMCFLAKILHIICFISNIRFF